jgi:hypothetical protein
MNSPYIEMDHKQPIHIIMNEKIENLPADFVEQHRNQIAASSQDAVEGKLG